MSCELCRGYYCSSRCPACADTDEPPEWAIDIALELSERFTPETHTDDVWEAVYSEIKKAGESGEFESEAADWIFEEIKRIWIDS